MCYKANSMRKEAAIVNISHHHPLFVVKLIWEESVRNKSIVLSFGHVSVALNSKSKHSKLTQSGNTMIQSGHLRGGGGVRLDFGCRDSLQNIAQKL